MKQPHSDPGQDHPRGAAQATGVIASLRQQIQHRAPSALALGYGGFGLAWIVFSDQLLHRVAPDASILSAVGQGKGIAFVLATSCLLYVVATRRNAPAADIDAEQSDYLRERGCDEMQGYHFGRPAPAAALQQRLAAEAAVEHA